MIRIFGIFMALMSMSAMAVAQSAPSSATITWLGQATFMMETSTGLKVLLDPTNPGAYNPAPVNGLDAITISHEHGDHNYIAMATGSPLVIRGLSQDGFVKVDQTIKGVRIRTVASFHDAGQGAQRGKNALFIFEMPGLRIAHLGDLGHKLTEQEVSEIGPVDVLMTPIAGGPTIDPKTAGEVINQLQAKVIIPMHYATAAVVARAAAPAPGQAARKPSMGGIDESLKALEPSVKVEQAGHTITFTAGKLPSVRTVYVMKYEQ